MVKMDYQPRSNLVKDKKGDLHADAYNILNKWRNYSQLLNVHRFSDIRQIEIHTAESLVPEPSPLQVEIAVAILKSYKSPDIDQIPEEVIHEGSETIWSEIHKLINSTWNKEELPDQWKESTIVRIYKQVKLTVVIIMGYQCYQLHTKLSFFFSQGWVHT
jgi:hypothetical protein